jgi:DNA-binding transcriptional LysR family regulator
MNIKQLETFVRIVELGSFGAAAEALHASPSTVSARVRELETSLGTQLFDRHFHRAQLTPKGHELFERAQQLIAFAASLRETISDPSVLTGTLRLGVVGVVAGTWLPRLVERLRTDHPALNLRIDVALTGVVLERLRTGQVDVAIVAGRIDDDALAQEVIGHDDFVWMAAPALGVPATPLGPAELKRWPILSLTEESHHYPVLRQWFREAGAQLGPVLACNNLDVLAECTAAGLGVSLLPRACYAAELAANALVVLDTRPPIAPVPFSLVYRRDQPGGMAAVVAAKAREAAGMNQPPLA